MDEKREEELPYDKAIGDILGIVNCLLITADVKAFKKWISKFHSSEVGNDHLPGYILVFNTLFRMLTSQLERNNSLGLTSDDVFDRATFKGISVNKLPNTCEKTVLIRNLQYYFKDVIHANSWDSLETAMQRLSGEVLAPFNNIKQLSSLNKNHPVREIETAVTYSSMFQTYIFLNDTSRGTPHGYVPAMLDDQDYGVRFRYSAAETLGNTFLGYKYAVQFLWCQLLRDRFKDSVVSSIHKTDDWDSFDKYFDKIQSEIIEPLEKSTGGVIGYDYFILVEKNSKEYFRELLKEKIPEIRLSAEEYLQRIFLWYPIQLIDSSDYSFSGIPAFIPLLMGMIQSKRRAKDKSKAKVVRIIHGKFEEHRRSYSYAILTELSGYISDSSGWLLFYDCCDDRGSTSGLFREVETLLERYTENNFIDITSFRIEKQALLEFTKIHHDKHSWEP
jgi:hypothetical protein